METMHRVAMQLVSGKTKQAKQTLLDNTDLTKREINELVEGVYGDFQDRIDEYRETAAAYMDELNEIAEAASTYAQQVLWVVFASTAIGLAVSILGGWLGADTTRRLYFEVRKSTDTQHVAG